MNYEHTVKIQMMIIYTFYWKFVGLDFGLFPLLFFPEYIKLYLASDIDQSTSYMAKIGVCRCKSNFQLEIEKKAG